MKTLLFVLLLVVGCESEASIREANKRYYDERAITIKACVDQGGVPETSVWNSRIICTWKGEKR